MPNLLPDWLPWIQPAGRLILSSLLLLAGVVVVMTLMRPPVLTRPFPARAGYALFAVVPVLAYVVALLLPADASIWGFELDALLVDLVLLFWFAHAVLMIASRPVRPADEPSSWAACFLGAVAVFALMTLAYGVVPHEWMEFANGYLQWGDTSKFVWQSNQSMLFFPWNWPFNLNYPAVRDIVVSGLYGVLLGLNIFLFAKWQTRKTVAETATAAEDATPAKRSRFGRPIRRGRPVAAGGA